MSTDQGRFVLVRSDHLSIVIDKPGVPVVIGRSRGLQQGQVLAGKYASREQFSVVWRPPSLFVTQIGKNPTFFGADSQRVPLIAAPALEFRGATGGGQTEPTVAVAADGHRIVTLPLVDPTHTTAAPSIATHAPDTLFFPSEVGLPVIAIRCERTAETAAEGANAATSKLTAAQMLSVPTIGGGGLSDDEEDEESGRDPRPAPGGGGGGGANSGFKPEWQGLLDAAMQQQNRQQAAAAEADKQQQATSVDVTPSRPSASLPPTPAPTPVPVPQPAEPAPSAAPAPVASTPAPTPTPMAAPAASAAEPKMGFWEWKCQANGRDSDPKSWRKYSLAVAKLLEAAYRAKKATVAIPDGVIGIGGGKRDRDEDKSSDNAGDDASTYSVCFSEESLSGGMIQYQNDDRGRFRVVRRDGGDKVDRHGVKPVSIIPTSGSDDDDDSDDDSDDDFTSSESESISESSNSEDGGRKPKKKNTNKNKRRTK